MNPTIIEKVQSAILCELAKPPEDRRLNFDLIRRAIFNDDLWVFDRLFNIFDLDVPMPPEVQTVKGIFSM